MLHKTFTCAFACYNIKTLYISYTLALTMKLMWWLDLSLTSQLLCSVTFFSLSFIYVVLQNKPNFVLKLSLCFISATKLLLLWSPIVAKGCSDVLTVFSIEQAQNSIRHKQNRQNTICPLQFPFHHTDIVCSCLYSMASFMTSSVRRTYRSKHKSKKHKFNPLMHKF
jgi:hypothetical protein